MVTTDQQNGWNCIYSIIFPQPVIYFIGLPYVICSLAVRPARHFVQI